MNFVKCRKYNCNEDSKINLSISQKQHVQDCIYRKLIIKISLIEEEFTTHKLKVKRVENVGEMNVLRVIIRFINILNSYLKTFIFTMSIRVSLTFKISNSNLSIIILSFCRGIASCFEMM